MEIQKLPTCVDYPTAAVDAFTQQFVPAPRITAPGGPTREAVTVSLADIPSERLEWLWPGRMALGKLAILVGDPDLGKSFITLDLAARVSCGGTWPDDPQSMVTPGDVLLFNAEDGLADTVRPRLEAAGGVVRRIAAITAVREAGTHRRTFSLNEDLDLLEQHLDKRPETRLVIIDPIAAFLNGGRGNNDSDIREVLTPLADLAQQRRTAIVVVTHLNKRSGVSAMYRAMGSLAFVAAARSAWGVIRDPADAGRRLLLPIKNNLAPGTPGLAYHLVSHEESGTARVGWFPEPVLVTMDDILQQLSGAASRREFQDAMTVVSWLKNVLSHGPEEADTVRRMAEQEGIAPRQLRAAADKLQIRRQKGGFLEGWTWELPKDAQRPKQPHRKDPLDLADPLRSVDLTERRRKAK